MRVNGHWSILLVRSTKGHQFFKNHHLGGFPSRSEGDSLTGSCLMGRSLLADLMEKEEKHTTLLRRREGMSSS
jgi:hypothetical protein